MKENVDYLLEYAKEFLGDLASNMEELESLVQLSLGQMHSVSLAKEKVKSYEKMQEQFVYKIGFHCLSIIKICHGVVARPYGTSLKSTILDLPSIYTLTRSILECYITLEYIYFQKISEEEKFFRYKLWEVSGLISRQGLNTGGNIDYEEIKKNEEIIIQKVRDYLKKDKHYKGLSPHQKRNLENFGLPRIFSWHTLIEKSSLHTESFKTMYGLFSNYAHSESLAMIQIQQTVLVKHSDEVSQFAATALRMSRMIQSKLIMDLKERFKSCEEYYNGLSQDVKSKISYWSMLATNFKSI